MWKTYSYITNVEYFYDWCKEKKNEKKKKKERKKNNEPNQLHFLLSFYFDFLLFEMAFTESIAKFENAPMYK